MHFGNLVKIVTKSLDITRKTLYTDLIDIYEKAEREYKKTGYRLHAGSTPLSELDLERDMDRLNRCADPSREIVQELAEGFYISFLYYLNRKLFSGDLDSIKQTFEKYGVHFIGNSVKLNFHLLLKRAFPAYYNTSDGAIYEGAVLDTEEIKITSSIPTRTDYPKKTEFYGSFETFNIDGFDIHVPYNEIYGIQQGISFSEGQNIKISYLPCGDFDSKDTECRHCGKKAKTKEYLTDLTGVCTSEEFEEKISEKRAAAAEKGYHHHPAKLWLTKFRRNELNPDEELYQLDLEFGCSGYLEHLVYQDILKENEDVRGDFYDVIRSFPQSVKFNAADTVWSRAGGGIWIVTQDNYLIVSYRGQTVNEIPGVISYSSSGGFDRMIRSGFGYEDNTPVKNTLKEAKEELNIELRSEDVEFISFGIDLLGGPWMQFSFFAECGLKKDDIKRSSARDNHEFCAFFIPFTKDAVGALLSKAEFEAGAAYSLYEIWKCRFES